MDKPNIVFLDIDEVLNNARSCCAYRTAHRLDPVAVAVLLDILEQGSAEIVLSSTWRNHDNVLDTLDANGIPIKHFFYGPNKDFYELKLWKTGRSKHGFRGDEVDTWLEKYGHLVDSYVILDDSSDFAPHHPLVYMPASPSGHHEGMMMVHRNEALDILQGVIEKTKWQEDGDFPLWDRHMAREDK